MLLNYTDKKTIPNYELLHNNEEVAFAIRSTKDVMEMFGEKSDKPHRHNYYTVLWSHNNGGTHIVDYKEFELRPNDIFFVSPGQAHQVKRSNKSDGTIILCTCDFLEKNSISEKNFLTLIYFQRFQIQRQSLWTKNLL